MTITVQLYRANVYRSFLPSITGFIIHPLIYTLTHSLTHSLTTSHQVQHVGMGAIPRLVSLEEYAPPISRQLQDWLEELEVWPFDYIGFGHMAE